MWIDPPTGWMYGFPKTITKKEYKDLNKWLVENGYPEEDLELAKKYSRYWYEEGEEHWIYNTEGDDALS